MEKRRKFGKLDKLIKAEQDRQARKIEESLSQDGSFDPDKIDREALYQRIQEGIQENRERKKKMELERAMIRRKKRLRWVEKTACFFIVAGITAFCASMTSEANRTYLNDKIQYLTGDNVVIRMGNVEQERNMEDLDEKEKSLAYQEIQEKLGIPVPDFRYEPEGLRKFGYNIWDGDAIATIRYQYEDTIISFCMVNKDKAEVSTATIEGKIVKKVDILRGALTIPIQKIKDSGDEEPGYAAQWEYKGGYYQLSGKIEEKEFLEIVENIYY